MAPFVLVVSLAVVVGGCLRAARPDHPARPRNLLWIVVDTLRADHLSCYGGPVATPAIDRLAASGIRFERAYSHIPITGPSHATMFTGELPLQHGVHNNADVLGAQHETIAETFRDHGFRTAAVISLGVLDRKFGFDQGFDHFDAHFPMQWFRPADEITDAAINIVSAVEQGPFFLFVHYSDPHEPYTPPSGTYPDVRIVLNGVEVGVVRADGYAKRVPAVLAPGRNRIRLTGGEDEGRWQLVFRHLAATAAGQQLEMRLRRGWNAPAGSTPGPKLVTRLPAALEVDNIGRQPLPATLGFFVKQRVRLAEKQQRYNREIAFADRQIGRLLSTLRERGDLDGTLIVFTSDHGEGMGDHGLVGHVHQLYDSLLQVPLIFTGAGVPTPRIEQRPVALVDLAPTLLEVFGIAGPHAFAGRSLLHLEQGAPFRFLAMTFKPQAKRSLMAAATGRYKLIVDLDSNECELYDLLEDPQERSDLHPGSSELEERLLAEVRAGLATAGERSLPAVLSDAERERLEALGYLR